MHTARTYKRGYLRYDITAGLILTALLVPAGMGYASAAGLPPIYGLYATIVPLVAYADLRALAHPGAGAGLRRWRR